MSPEQIRAPAAVDARTDVWALGAILYELVTGQTAFVGPSVPAVLEMVTCDDPCPMSALRRDVPRELEAIVMRCLERDRERRWPSVGALAVALAPFGSLGIVSQLASVQRELGSRTSLRAASSPSVEPMVANVREDDTAPDVGELIARESIAHGWRELRARRRRANAAVLVLASLTAVAGTVAVVLHTAARGPGARDGRAARVAAAAPPAAVVALPPAAVASAPAAVPRAVENMHSAPKSLSFAPIVQAAPPVASAPRTTRADDGGGARPRE
jgi:serine/threonine-protein kinase